MALVLLRSGWKATKVATVAALGALVIVSVLVALGPLTGRYRTLTVVSGSMSPAIPVGSVLLYTPIAPTEVSEGDVITFHPPGSDSLVTHRVTNVTNEPGQAPKIRTRGDANNAEDPWQVRLVEGPVWKVRGHVPFLGTLLVWLKSTALLRFAALVLPVAVGVLWLVRIWSNPEPARDPAV